MLIGTWNLNNRVGKVRFRPEAADAAVSLNADIIVFTEYYPQEFGETFSNKLRNAGWHHQRISKDSGEKANRVLVASKFQLEALDIPPPDFDLQYWS